ncbi:MAG: DUF167 domain-containing protein [bacterium]
MATESDPERFKLTVKVNPGTSRRNSVWRQDHLKVNLTAPPEDGRANQELVDYVSDLFELDQSDVRIESGVTSRQKELIRRNLDRETLTRTLESLN